MPYSNWINSTRPKVQGTMNLHKALDFFVMTSSVSDILGTPGQSNYAAGNSVLGYLARHRVLRGQKATSLILTMVLGVGYVAEHLELEQTIQSKGIYSIDENHLLASFETSIAIQQGNGSVDHIGRPHRSRHGSRPTTKVRQRQRSDRRLLDRQRPLRDPRSSDKLCRHQQQRRRIWQDDPRGRRVGGHAGGGSSAGERLLRREAVATAAHRRRRVRARQQGHRRLRPRQHDRRGAAELDLQEPRPGHPVPAAARAGADHHQICAAGLREPECCRERIDVLCFFKLVSIDFSRTYCRLLLLSTSNQLLITCAIAGLNPVNWSPLPNFESSFAGCGHKS